MRLRYLQYREWLRVPLMLTPAVLILGALFGFGMFLGAARSFGYSPYRDDNLLTLEHYRSVIENDRFVSSFVLTFQIALISTVLSMIIAVAIALVLRNRFRGQGFATFVFQVPLPVPHLVAASAMLLLVTQSGIISRLTVAMGVTQTPADFPVLTFDAWGISIILSYLWKEVPFIGLVVLAILKGIGPQFEELAMSLGASRWQRFRYVILPLIMPGLLSSSVIVFAFAFSSYEIPLLLGVPDPAVLSVFSFRLFNDPDITLRPQAMAASMVLAISALLFLLLYRRLARKTFG